jgi:membrane fusion protein (multidrug efflux system)
MFQPHPTLHPLRHSLPPAAVAVAFALWLSGCSNSAARSEGPSAEPAAVSATTGTPATAAVPVEIVQPHRADLVARHEGTATLEAEADTEVVARVGGAVQRILVEEGARVRPGELLAVIDPRQLRLEAAQARAQFERTETDYRRQVELHQRGLVAAGAFDGTRFDLAQKRAAYELATLQLTHTELRAPFGGVVAERRVRVGQNLAVGTTAFRIVDATRLRAAVHVPEAQLARLRPGQPAELGVDALPQRRFAARVARISPTVDPRTATVKVTLELSDRSGGLRPGMFARVGILFEQRSGALVIPAHALVEDAVAPTVFVVERGKAVPRALRIGLEDHGLVEVLTGLRGDERIVVTGQNGLKPGHSVRVVALEADSTRPAG